MKLAISIEGMCGLTWPRWKRLITEIEQMGFAGLFRSDHFTFTDPPDLDSLEMIISLAYLTDHSQNLHFGPLVAPLSFRDPIFLARQAMALDDLSGGRMILGVGAGWLEREHSMFGYHLGDIKTRMDRLEEGLEIITQLIRSDEPVTFTGRFYQLQEALLLPRPQRATPVLVGGNGPKRTLPLVARYANIWSFEEASVDVFRERSALLDDLLRCEGRQLNDVTRTVLLPVMCWRNESDRKKRMNELCNSVPSFAAATVEGTQELFRKTLYAILGSPEQIIKELNAYVEAGAEEIIIQWYSLDDIEGLEAISEHVLPYLSA